MNKSSLLLTIIISLHLALGLLYDWATPIFEASDEGSHFAVVHWLAQGHPLPVQNPQAPSLEWAQEGSQPPLYYLLAAGLTTWIDTHDFDQIFIRNPFSRVGIPGTTHNANLYRHPLSAPPLTGTVLAVKLVRWFSLLLSCLTVLLTFKLALRLFPGNESLALLASALVAFNPMALFINASVNNDNLLMLLSTASLLAIVNLTQASPPSPDDGGAVVRRGGRGGEAILGLLLGAAALTKVSGLVLWPVAFVAIILDEGRRMKDEGQTLSLGPWALSLRPWTFVLRLLLVFTLASLLSFWWYWRNYQLYGDWLGLKTMIAIAGPREPAITLWQLIRDEWRGFILSYWGVFGAFTILPSGWVQLFFDGLMLWALVGGGWALLKRRIPLHAELLLLGLFCLLTLVGLINWTMQTFASQGRLMFGAIAPLSIFMAAGILSPFEGKLINPTTRLGPLSLALGPWPFGIWSLGFGIFLFLLAALIPPAFIAPHYAPPSLIQESALPHDLQPVHATFGDGIELIGYRVDDKPRTPGQTLPVAFYWRALKPMTMDYAVAMHLLGQGATEVGKIDTWPGGGNAPTAEWSPETILIDTYQMPISPQALTPSRLRLDLKFWESEPANTLPMTTSDGRPLSSVIFTVGRLTPMHSTQFDPAHVNNSTFEYGIKLLGVDADERGTFTLYWQTAQIVPADYTVFVHLLDSQGTQVAQADGPPLAGDWPTSAWVVGQPFADARRFDLSAPLPPGVYNLRLGFYDPASGARLAAFQPDGLEWPDNAVVINHVFEIN
jgi:hypothetical protein